VERLDDNSRPKRGLVWVAPRRRRGILLGDSPTGAYRVLVDNEVVEFSAQEILPFDAEHPPETSAIETPAAINTYATENESLISQTLALHDLNARDAVDLLDKKIQRATYISAGRIKVMYGDEKGKIRKAIHEYLDHSKKVKCYRDDEKRTDVTWVYLHPLSS